MKTTKRITTAIILTAAIIMCMFVFSACGYSPKELIMNQWYRDYGKNKDKTECYVITPEVIEHNKNIDEELSNVIATYTVEDDNSLITKNKNSGIVSTYSFVQLRDEDVKNGLYEISDSEWYVSKNYLIYQGKLFVSGDIWWNSDDENDEDVENIDNNDDNEEEPENHIDISNDKTDSDNKEYNEETEENDNNLPSSLNTSDYHIVTAEQAEALYNNQTIGLTFSFEKGLLEYDAESKNYYLIFETNTNNNFYLPVESDEISIEKLDGKVLSGSGEIKSREEDDVIFIYYDIIRIE